MTGSKFGEFLYNNGLTLTLYGLFLAMLVGMSIAGFYHQNEELAEHGWLLISYGEYIVSGEFAEAVFENWESEFLQMWALVVLTIYLHQKGAPDSKKLHHKEGSDSHSRAAMIDTFFRHRKRRTIDFLYEHSLGLALLSIFIVSFVLHAVGGVGAYNDQALQHGQATVGIWQYIASAQFWFESLQNWQSEFLAVATLLVLSIFLRERGSPESKPIDAKHSQTGR